MKLTKQSIERQKPGSTDTVLWDSETRGFGCRVRKAGGRHFIFRYRVGGLQRLWTIGEFGQPWTVDGARDEAKKLQGLVAKGIDPASDREVGKQRPTVEKVVERFKEEYLPRLKPSTQRNYAADLDRLAASPVGRARIDRVVRADVATYQHELRHAHVAHNRSLAALSKLFSWSEALGLRAPSSNPCRGIQRFRETRRQRFLSAEEIARLGNVLRRAEAGELKASTVDEKGDPVLDENHEPRAARFDPAGLLALRLLLLTGARKSEVLTLRWSEVDITSGCLRLSDSKTGPKVVPIGAPALALLAKAPRIGEWVIPGLSPATHRSDIKDLWNGQRTPHGRRVGIQELAELKDARVHDLRHAFASVAVSGGATLPLVGALLGHREASTTQRYAHAAPDPVRAVAEMTSTHIANLLDGATKAPVPIRARARR